VTLYLDRSAEQVDYNPNTIYVDIVLIKPPPDGLKGFVHLCKVLQLPINATQLYKQAKTLPYTMLEKVYFGMADNFIKRLNNPEIIQAVEREDYEVMATEYIVPDEAKQLPNLPKELSELITLDIRIEGILALPQDYANINNFNNKQAGYRYNALTGEYLVSDKIGEWQDGWYVFATNYFDDPFYIDFTEEALGFPVYYCQHGAGEWKSIKIAETLKHFERVLRALESKGFDAPFELSELPIEIDLSNEFWIDANENSKRNLYNMECKFIC